MSSPTDRETVERLATALIARAMMDNDGVPAEAAATLRALLQERQTSESWERFAADQERIATLEARYAHMALKCEAHERTIAALRAKLDLLAALEREDFAEVARLRDVLKETP